MMSAADAYAYCAELVRTSDRDRYVAALFAPAGQRDALYALYAFDAELARVRDAAREALPGEIRLQWWSDVLAGERTEEAAANPVAAALSDALARRGLAAGTLANVIEARRFDLYDEPMATLADLEAYLAATASAPIAVAAQLLGAAPPAAARPAGIALGIAGLLHAMPRHAARGQLFVPLDVLHRHGASADELFAGQSTAGIKAALRELGELARRQLDLAHAQMPAVPPQALPAFLGVATVRRSLHRLRRCDPFSPAALPPWRRQWLIWRAARNSARIAG